MRGLIDGFWFEAGSQVQQNTWHGHEVAFRARHDLRLFECWHGLTTLSVAEGVGKSFAGDETFGCRAKTSKADDPLVRLCGKQMASGFTLQM